MRHPLALALTFLAASPALGQAPAARTRPASPAFTTGASPDAPSALERALRADLSRANAAAQAGLARLKTQPVAKPLTEKEKLALAAHAAGLMPCERTLFNVDGAAANFQIQPGQLVLLNGCFKGSSNAEVRIAGKFPPYGYLLLEIQNRGDGYFYGQVPDVAGVPDQTVSISVRFLSDGHTTIPRNGFFKAKRQSWEAAVTPGVCKCSGRPGRRRPGAKPGLGFAPHGVLLDWNATPGCRRLVVQTAIERL